MSQPAFVEVQPQQGPPLWLPASFFLIAPVAIAGAGALLFAESTTFATRFLPSATAITHLGTLGFLGSVMLGALYQMLPVVAGSPVPHPRLGHASHLAFVAGVVLLVWGLTRSDVGALALVEGVLGAGFALFLLPIGYALARAPARTSTVTGMRISMAGLALVVVLGVLMVRTRAGAAPAADWITMQYVHLAVGGIVWIGGLITAVSWQVVPMFYLTDAYPRWSRGVVLLAVGFSAAAALAVVVTEQSRWIYAAMAPGAVAVWLLHPAVTISLIARRRRRRVDESLRFWYAGLAAAPVVLFAAAAVYLSPHPRWPMLLGWTAIWGWAGLIMHGMLTRIVPFLVWFHRFSPRVGKEKVPSMRQLLPASHARAGLVAHGATLLLGWGAIVSNDEKLVLATATGLVLTGGILASELLRVLLHRGLPVGDGIDRLTDQERTGRS